MVFTMKINYSQLLPSPSFLCYYAYMFDAVIFTLAAVLAVSAISLIGVFFLAWRARDLSAFLLIFVGLAVGALLGDAFLHLIPESSAEIGTEAATFWVFVGLGIFFVLEKFLHWHHHHTAHSGDSSSDCAGCEDEHHHIAPFGTLAIFSDALHNVIDGAIIAAGFLVSPAAGLATTLAVALHEIPQEIGDFGVLLHAGMSRARALIMNFASALSAFIGAGIVLALGGTQEAFVPILSALAAGGFIYIAMSDLIPELHKETRPRTSLIQLGAVVVGVMLVFTLGAFEDDDHASEKTLSPEEHAAQETPRAVFDNVSGDAAISDIHAIVTRVIDGDTVTVRTSHGEDTVRLIGIDAPETAHAAGAAECYATEATADVKRYIHTGSPVVLRTDPTQDERDAYGRLLAYIILPEGTSLNATLVSDGAAREYTFKGRVYEAQELHRTLEKTAQEEKRGLWGSCL